MDVMSGKKITDNIRVLFGHHGGPTLNKTLLLSEDNIETLQNLVCSDDFEIRNKLRGKLWEI